MKYICKQCGKEFELTESEIDFYKSKNLSLPKRCKECREKNKGKMQLHTGHADERKGRRKNLSLITIIILLVISFVAHFGPNFGQSGDENSGNATGTTISQSSNEQNAASSDAYTFRSEKNRKEHYEKHGVHMGFSSEEDYEAAASAVATNPNALHKTESEDGDDVYYLEDTNEFVIVSTDGYIRTYFNPDDGIEYFDRQ